MAIRKGDYIGMLDSEIVAAGPELADVCKTLLDRMMAEGEEVVTLFEGRRRTPPSPTR